MPPATGPALIILVAFVLPGFVTVLIQESTFRRAEDPTTLDRLLRILYYSVWTYLLLALVALLVGIDRAYVEDFYKQNEGNPAELVWRAALLILLPAIIIATATRAWYGSRLQAYARKIVRINEHHAEPTGWDFFFRQSRNAHVRITFKDGGRVYGYYGGESFSAYAKDGGDLFLECVYADVDDWFGPVANHSCGVWVKTEDAVSVEFYDAEHVANATAERESPGSETTEGNGSQATAEATGRGKTAKEGLIDG
jgi:hypothetical protein